MTHWTVFKTCGHCIIEVYNFRNETFSFPSCLKFHVGENIHYHTLLLTILILFKCLIQIYSVLHIWHGQFILLFKLRLQTLPYLAGNCWHLHMVNVIGIKMWPGSWPINSLPDIRSLLCISFPFIKWLKNFAYERVNTDVLFPLSLFIETWHKSRLLFYVSVNEKSISLNESIQYFVTMYLTLEQSVTYWWHNVCIALLRLNDKSQALGLIYEWAR